MDCKTARLLFDYHRPVDGAMDPAEVDALDDHLAGCPECAVLFRSERQSDDQIGRALRNVAVPAGLKERLLAGLAVERAKQVEQPRRRWLRVAAAAALLLAVGWVAQQWLNPRLPTFAIQRLWEELRFGRPNEDTVRTAFRRLGHGEALPPTGYNYDLLVAYGITEFDGHQVPQLVFVSSNRRQQVEAYARVLILTSSRFDLSNLKEFQPEEGYSLRLVVDPGENQAYLVVHTGDNLNWLEAKDEGPAA